MMNRTPLAILVLLITLAVGCGKRQDASTPASFMKDRAIVVSCDMATGEILSVESLRADALVGEIAYTNGPSVGVLCIGDLVNPVLLNK